jgi:hypothetical protein
MINISRLKTLSNDSKVEIIRNVVKKKSLKIVNTVSDVFKLLVD